MSALFMPSGEPNSLPISEEALDLRFGLSGFFGPEELVSFRAELCCFFDLGGVRSLAFCTFLGGLEESSGQEPGT